MNLPILLAFFPQFESYQSLRRATMHPHQKQRISAIWVNSLLETSLVILKWMLFSIRFCV